MNSMRNSLIIKIEHVVLVAFLVLSVYACTDSASDAVTVDMVKNEASAKVPPSGKLPEMTFDEDLHDFGVVVQGEKIRKTYHFTNTGKSELIITSAKGSCGCTVPSYPRKPIKPGEKGTIEVAFDTKDKEGKQHKKVYIVANTDPATNVIAIKGEIAAPISD